MRGMKRVVIVLSMLFFPAHLLIAQVIYTEGAKTSKWGGIGVIQSSLKLPVNGAFGEDTRSALYHLQSLLHLSPTGHLDLATWRVLTNRSLPTVQERSEALTFTFE